MIQASIDDDNKVDETTVQWAREALQRRRKEMRQQKEDLIASYRQDVMARDSVSLTSAASPTHPMIERGKMILAETEAQSDILIRYASFQNSINTTPTSTPQQQTIAPNLPIESSPYSWDEDVECEEVGSSDNDELLTEDEARAKLQELIATMNRNRRDDDVMDLSENTLTIKSFDPSSMNTAKVAVQRKVKLDEALAAAAAESRLISSFKALPLPSGAEVKHNIFAPTQAFQGKQIMGGRTHDPTTDDNCKYAPSSLSGSSSFFRGVLDDSLSVRTSVTSHDDDDSFGAASSGVHMVRTEADKERAKQLMADRKMKKKQILDEVDRIVMGEDTMTPALIAESAAAAAAVTNGEASCDIMSVVVVEDPAKLLQDIAHLKAKLKQKKTDRLAILNDIVDIDLNAPFDRLIHGKVVGDEIKNIIDRLKKRVCGDIADYDSSRAHSSSQDTSSLSHKMSATSPPTTNLTPIFIRQQQWAKQREQKLLNARLQQEADAMNGITGVPQISDATQSWKRARELHDETLRRVAEEDAKKQQVREEKEKALREELVKETETENKEVEVAKALITNEADTEERRKRIESLARPRQVRAAFAASMESGSSKDEEHEQQHPPTDLPSKSKIVLSPQPKKKMTRAISIHDEGRTDLATTSAYSPSNLTSVEKKPEKFCGMNSFAEMSDKEFAKLIKSIGKGLSFKDVSSAFAP